MSGFCLLICLAALLAVAIRSIRRGQSQRRAVLLLSPNVSVRTAEIALRGGLNRLGAEYAVVVVYGGVWEGERQEILRRLCEEYNMELADRRGALRLWRGQCADFWRLCADGGLTKIR